MPNATDWVDPRGSSQAARTPPDGLGVVAIGLNLGSRLETCLRSVIGRAASTVYVDSHSTDGTEAFAQALGVPVVRPSSDRPMTAARARNLGFEHLSGSIAGLEFVQFVDGDCELDPAWLGRALQEMRTDPRLGVVCGRVSERQAGRNTAATLLDIEWQGDLGDVPACGGIFLARARAFVEAGGFSDGLATGEEAEFCGRLRSAAWVVRRIDAPMCIHDAGMHTVREWLGRCARVGQGYARMAAHDPGARRKIRSAILWAVALPATAVAGAVATWWNPLAGLVPAGIAALYLVQIARIGARQRRVGRTVPDSIRYGFFSLVAKGAHVLGFLRNRRHALPT